MSVNTITKIRKWAGRYEFTVNGEHIIGEIDDDDVEEYRLFLSRQLEIVSDYISRERPAVDIPAGSVPPPPPVPKPSIRKGW